MVPLTDIGQITVRQEHKAAEGQVIFTFTWSDESRPARVSKDMLTLGNDNLINRYGDLVRVGPWDCHVIYEDDETIYITKDSVQTDVSPTPSA